MKFEFEGGINHYLNVNLDWFHVVTKRHLGFGSVCHSQLTVFGHIL